MDKSSKWAILRVNHLVPVRGHVESDIFVKYPLKESILVRLNKQPAFIYDSRPDPLSNKIDKEI